MKPIKNVFPASEGSEKWYSVNEGESTKMLGGRKRDEAGSLGRRLQLCPLFSIALTLFQRHIILLEIVVLANSKKNRNIKAHDVNLISIARSTDFCFKTTYVSMFLCFRLIVGSWKRSFPWTPLPLGNYCLWTPPPSRNFQWSSVGGGGGGYGYFLEPHNEGGWWKWMKVNEGG